MSKIIHLTDLHIGNNNGGNRGKKHPCEVVFNNIVDNIIKDERVAKSDIIVITGDLVESAYKEENYEMAKKAIGRFKENKFKHVLVIPGNHDYGRGTRVEEKYVEKFKDTFFGDTKKTYPKYDPIGNIAFIGLDSLAEAFDRKGKNGNYGIMADGKLGEAQLDGLVKKLGEATKNKKVKHIVVYLHHHPFKQLDAIGGRHHYHGHPVHGLKDHPALTKILKEHNSKHNNNISALLFGHNHKGGYTWKNNRTKIPRCYDGGTSTGVGGKPVSVHRVFNLEGEPGDDFNGDFYKL